MLNLKQSLEEYFEYHPPIKPERIALHNGVNKESLEIFKLFLAANVSDFQTIADIYDQGYLLLEQVCKESTCYRWVLNSLLNCKNSCVEHIEREENLFMYIQQYRMFLNQAITIQELDNI